MKSKPIFLCGSTTDIKCILHVCISEPASASVLNVANDVNQPNQSLSFPILVVLFYCRYLLRTLDQYVENDYTIVYFHFGLTSKNKPGMSKVIQLYRELDRK